MEVFVAPREMEWGAVGVEVTFTRDGAVVDVASRSRRVVFYKV